MFSTTLTIPSWILLAILFILSTTLILRRQNQHDRKQPPGPPALPVVGHLHMLGGNLPHRTLQTLSQRYGPIMFLRLGQVPTIVVSNSEAAEQFLKTNDTVFSSRPKFQYSEYFSYGSKGLVFSEYGPYWRNMRKVCTLHLLSVSKVESFAPLRKRELDGAVKSLEKRVGEVVDVTEVVHRLIEEIVYKMVLGSSKDDKFDLKGLVQEGMGLSGKFNIADYVPWLGALDLQGLTRKFKQTSKALDEVLEKIIKDHEHAFTSVQNGRHKDFVDIFLSLMHQPIDPHDEKNSVIDRTNIKAVVLDMISGAFETSSTAIIWALTELLRHPRVMKNLQDELGSVIGMNKLVEENDLVKLSYLDMVIKETLRLYPAGSLNIRESIEDVTIQDYYIKKKSRLLINIWAIGRDPKVWDSAEMFYPERFINNNIDIGGNDFELIPFGSGRRRCPGMHLGLNSVKLVVSQLVHCFNWELPQDVAPDDLDMSEKFGLSMPRAQHLLAVPTYRLSKVIPPP